MISAQNKRLGVADHDVQPMEESRNQDIGLVFMGVALQRWDITAIAIAVDLTAIGEGGAGKFLHRRLLDIGCYPPFQKAGIAMTLSLVFKYHGTILSSAVSHNPALSLAGLKG